MARKTSIVDGVTMADERMQYALNSIKKAIAQGLGTGGAPIHGTSYPIPYFGPAGTTYWRVDNSLVSGVTVPDGSTHTVDDFNLGTDDDNEDGGGLVSFWLIPNDCATLRGVIRGVKRNGRYGRVLHFNFEDIDDEERALGFCERTIRGLRPKWVYDITRATSVATGGGTAHNPIEPTKGAKVAPQVTAGATRATSLQAWPNPVALSPAIGYGPYGSAPHYPLYQNPALPAGQGEALARLDLTNYAPLNVRITAVGAPEKERGGIFYPVTVTFAAGLVDVITLRGFRVGRKPEDYTKYGKQYRRWRFELSETDRDAGTAVLRVGPFGPEQAKQPWHLTRIHAVDFRDETQTRKTVEWYPAVIGDCAGPDDISIAFATSPSTDLDSAYQKAKSNSLVSSGRVPGAAADGSVTADPDDVSSGQAANFQNAQTSDGTGGTPTGSRRVLAVLAPAEPVDGKLAGFVVTTAPDLATEKDSDAYIRFTANIQTPAGAASTAGDANATEAIFKFYRKGDTDVRDNYINKRVELNPTDDMAELTFHRKIGRGFHMKKMRLRNAVSKVDTDLKTQTGGGLTSGVFFAGQTGGAYTDTDADTGIGSVTLADADSGNPESNKAHIKATIVNNGVGGLPVIPKRLLVYVSRRGTVSDPGSIPADNPTTGNWRLEKELALGDEPNLATIATVARTFAVKLRRKKDHWIRARLYVKGSSTPIDSSSLLYTSDSELPVKNYAHGTKNLIIGGGFLFSAKDFDNSLNDTDLGKKWHVAIGGARINTTVSTTQWYWDRDNHRLIRPSGSANDNIYTKIRRLLQPGEVLTFTFLAKAAVTTLPDLAIAIVKDDGSVIASATYGLLNSIGTSFEMHEIQLTLPSTYSLNANQGVYFKFTASYFGGNQTLYFDNFMLVRGAQAKSWDMSSAEEEIDGNGGAITISDTGAGSFDAAAGGGNDGLGAGGKILL